MVRPRRWDQSHSILKPEGVTRTVGGFSRVRILMAEKPPPRRQVIPPPISSPSLLVG